MLVSKDHALAMKASGHWMMSRTMSASMSLWKPGSRVDSVAPGVTEGSDQPLGTMFVHAAIGAKLIWVACVATMVSWLELKAMSGSAFLLYLGSVLMSMVCVSMTVIGMMLC